MSIPSSLNLSPLALKPRPDGHPPVDATHLDFDIVSQAPRVNWCWAAVTAAISAYYVKREADPVSQKPASKCQTVNRVLGGSYPADCAFPDQVSSSKCCKTQWGIGSVDACETPAAADMYGRPSCGIRRAGLAVDYSAGAASYRLVATEIDAKRPLVMYVAWQNGGNHMVCIAGYDPATQMLSIADPQTQGDVNAPGHWATMPAGGPYRPSEGGIGNWGGTFKTGTLRT